MFLSAHLGALSQHFGLWAREECAVASASGEPRAAGQVASLILPGVRWAGFHPGCVTLDKTTMSQFLKLSNVGC